MKKVKVFIRWRKGTLSAFQRTTISGANCLVLDEPTNHLDMESITAPNNGLIKFPGVALFSCHDHQVCTDNGKPYYWKTLPDGTLIDEVTTYDEYLESDEMARKRTVYTKQDGEDDD